MPPFCTAPAASRLPDLVGLLPEATQLGDSEPVPQGEHPSPESPPAVSSAVGTSHRASLAKACVSVGTERPFQGVTGLETLKKMEHFSGRQTPTRQQGV